MRIFDKYVGIDDFYISMQISRHGYISMGTEPNTTSPSIPGTLNIVCPYGVYDPYKEVRVRYTNGSVTSSLQVDWVSSFIKYRTKDSFSGIQMVLVEWELSEEYFVVSNFYCFSTCHTYLKHNCEYDYGNY